MNEDYMIKALWIDDEYEKGTAFMDSAYEFGIDIDPVPCVEDGIEKLNDTSVSYDAIILDANCKVSRNPNELATIDTLGEAINRLIWMHSKLPWFVYTAANYQGTEHLKSIIKVGGKRSYDDRDFYVKPNYKELLSNIKKAVEGMPTFVIKQKYADALKTYSGEDIIQLLIRRDNEDISNAVDYPNKVRGVLDKIMTILNEKGMLPVLFKESSLNECSRCLGSLSNELVPVYIKVCFEHCVRVSNEGSHHELPTYQLLSKGQAPYLNESLIVDLLNILHWCGTIDEPKEELQKKTIKSYISNKRNNVQHYGCVIYKESVRYLSNNVKGDINLTDLDKDKVCKEGNMYAYIRSPKENKFIPLAYI